MGIKQWKNHISARVNFANLGRRCCANQTFVFSEPVPLTSYQTEGTTIAPVPTSVFARSETLECPVVAQPRSAPVIDTRGADPKIFVGLILQAKPVRGRGVLLSCVARGVCTWLVVHRVVPNNNSWLSVGGMPPNTATIGGRRIAVNCAVHGVYRRLVVHHVAPNRLARKKAFLLLSFSRHGGTR